MNNQCSTSNSAQQFGPAFAKFAHPGFNKFAKGPWGGGFRRPKYNVPINILDTDNAFEVHLYALGFAKADIKISVKDDVLYIVGTRTVDENNLPNFTRQEYPIKNFERAIALSETVDKTNILAKQIDGVLIITLPKTKDAIAPAQEITIN